MNKFPLVLLMLICFNLPHGPDKDEGMRFTQLQDSLEHLFRTMAPGACPLFESLAPAMLQDLGSAVPLLPGASPGESLWAFLGDKAKFPRKGYKVNLCRFMAFIREAASFLPEWSVWRFRAEYLALEMDFFQGKQFKQNLIVRQSLVNEVEHARTTDPAGIGIDAKLLRSCCQNAVCITAMVLGMDHNKRTLAVMCHIPAPIDEWHGKTNKMCRDVASNSSWLLGQLSGEYMASLVDILAQLGKEDVLRACGFMSFESCHASEAEAVHIADEEFAELAGVMALTLIGARLRRFLYCLCGWPYRLLLVQKGGSLAQEVLAAFKHDWEVYERLQNRADKPKELVTMLSRSPFRLTATKQWLAAFLQSNWEITEEVRAMAEERSRLLVSSQVCEDCFAVQKNAKQIRGSKKFRKPEVSLGVACAAEVVNKRHRYSTLPVTVAIGRKTMRLDKTVFGKFSKGRKVKPSLR